MKNISNFKKVVIILGVIVLTGCANRTSNLMHDDPQNLTDAGMGRIICQRLHNGKSFELGFSIPYKGMPNANDIVLVDIYSKEFNRDNTSGLATIKFTLDKDKVIRLVKPPLSRAEIKQLKDNKAILAGATTFIAIPMPKENFKQLINASNVAFEFSNDFLRYKGEIAQAEFEALKNFSTRLLNDSPVHLQTEAEAMNEINELFKDFIVLKYGAKKADLEKYFNTQFKLDSKNHKTNAYEEVVYPKLGLGKDELSSPLVLGFNEGQQLIYCRDFKNQEKISWLSPKK